MNKETVTQYKRIPPRDYVILPAIVLITVAVWMGGGEVFARILWREQMDVSCAYNTAAGIRFHPHCSSLTKAAEGPWITNSFNECGYRSAESCAIRDPHQLRIVVMGSSTARGSLVEYDSTFAARASAALTVACQETVDFQNLATESVDLNRIDQRIVEALALKPTAIVITISPYDLEHLKSAEVSKTLQHHNLTLHDLDTFLRQSRLFQVGQHFLYLDPAVQLAGFLNNGADRSRYVAVNLPVTWRRRIDDAVDLLRRITAQTDRVGVPVLLVYIPERPQAALANPKYARPDADAFAVQNLLRKASEGLGITFVDTTKDFAESPNFNSLFYVTNGHSSADGHAVIARDVTRALLAQKYFSQCQQPHKSHL